MNEAFLQTVWKYKLIGRSEFKGVKGETIELISIGEHNQDSGPDFFNSKIKIDGVVLAGNVELHMRTSDWMRHRHQYDKAYDNLVLHIVFEHDLDLEQNSKHNVSILELKNYLKPSLISQYQNLQNSQQAIPCGKSILLVNDFAWKSWLDRLAVSRIESKTQYIDHLFTYCNHNYEETLYLFLCRNFGFKINNEAFELLGKSLPLSVLKKYANNILQIEALLFGVAGFLENEFTDNYPRLLQNEFEFLKQKHRLIPIKKELWKFSKTRPVNFATIRLSQFASLFCKRESLYNLIEQKSSIDRLKSFFEVETNEYWYTHFKFDEAVDFNRKPFGEQAFQSIVINTIVPFLFFMSKHSANESFSEYGLNLLSQFKAEVNVKTKKFLELGIKTENALESQAQIHLYDNFCSKKACLHCNVAQALLKIS